MGILALAGGLAVTGCQSVNSSKARPAWVRQAMNYAQKTGEPSAQEMADWVRWIEDPSKAPPEIMVWARKEVAWKKIEPELRTDRIRPPWLDEAIEYARRTGQPVPTRFVVWVKWLEGSGKPPPEIMAWARQEATRKRMFREQWAKLESERLRAEHEAAAWRQKAERERIAKEREKASLDEAASLESQVKSARDSSESARRMVLASAQRGSEMTGASKRADDRSDAAKTFDHWAGKIVTVLEYAWIIYSEYQRYQQPMVAPTHDVYGNRYNDDILAGRPMREVSNSRTQANNRMLGPNENTLDSRGSRPVDGNIYGQGIIGKRLNNSSTSDHLLDRSNPRLAENTIGSYNSFRMYDSAGIYIGVVQQQPNGSSRIYDNRGSVLGNLDPIGLGGRKYTDPSGAILGSSQETLLGTVFRDKTGAIDKLITRTPLGAETRDRTGALLGTTISSGPGSMTLRDATGITLMASEASR